MLNLYELLPEKDKQIITNYVNKFGIHKDKYIGTQEFLKHWSVDKVKLYHALGNQFSISIPYEYTQSEDDICIDIRKTLLEHKLARNFDHWLWSEEMNEVALCGDFNRHRICDLFYSPYLARNNFPYDIIIKVSDEKKPLKIQKGTKTIKAIYKILEYFDWPKEYGLTKEDYEDFRLLHSQIFNTKKIKGNLVISIHPMDFITMSDNDNGWQSCMNWQEEGCYRLGTVEMMNSNNVVVCYLANEKRKFYFGGSKHEDEREMYSWNNKKWRQLFYVNKDIICSGKSYPYFNKDITLYLLDEIKKIVSSNMPSWSYSFGPQRYKDMITVHTEEDIDYYRETNSDNKIIFTTKAMYNDMISDKNFEYYCYRNKVKKNKLISVSGKHTCLCCGANDISGSCDEFASDYNDRYYNTENLICEDCIDDFHCYKCGCTKPTKKFKKFLGKSYCTECYEKWLRLCPSCGEVFDASIDRHRTVFAKKVNDFSVIDAIEAGRNFCYDTQKTYEDFKLIPLCMCESCRDKKIQEKVFEERYNYRQKPESHGGKLYFHWEYDHARYVSAKIWSKEEMTPYLFENLKQPSSQEEQKLD